MAIAVLGLTACASGGSLARTDVYSPPPPLALVAIVDPTSGAVGDELRQLAAVIQSNATPNEAVVVMLLHAGGTTYTVRPGDSISSVAAANSFTLAALEAANPQLGPLSGRNWSVIHPGERITLPDRGAANPLVLVTRAPAGPAPPTLVRPPQQPSNPTDFQRAEYAHALSSATTTNATRVSAWQAEAQRALQPWQKQVIDELEGQAGSTALNSGSTIQPSLSASITSGVTTLRGLGGRRLLLVLGGAEAGPGGLGSGSLTGIDLVIANLTDAGAAAAWTSAGGSAGAKSVTTLDPAVTQLQLAQVVNGPNQGAT